MTGRYRRAGLVVTAGFLLVGRQLAGQAVGNVAVAASFIEYDGFLSTGAALFSPSFQFDTPTLSMAAQGNWTVFESGNDVLQASAAFGWLTGSRRWWRLELSGSAGGSKYATERASGHLLGGARFHVVGARAGGWIGVGSGTLLGETGRSTPVELTAAGWAVRRRLTVVGAATVTRFGGGHYLDLLGTIRWAGPRVELEARVGARPSARFGSGGDPVTTGGYGEVTASIPVTSRFAFSLSGGNHLSDPVRRILGARYATAGIRLRAFGPPAGSVARPSAAAIMRRLGAPEAVAGRLEITASGAERVVRIQAPGVTSVELMADFTDWAVVSLAQVAPGVWEARLPVPPGIYRLNVRFGGGAWVAPAGTRVEQTEFGPVGIVVVSPVTN